MKPGTLLQLAKGPLITFTTVDDRNKVEFQGAMTSLSDAAVKAYAALGMEAQALSGLWAWTYQGRRLDDIRWEREEAHE